MTDTSYWDILSETARRVADAAAAQSGLRSRTARGYLRARLAAPPGSPDSLLADPVVEPALPWTNSNQTTGALKGGLLTPDLVRALGSAKGGFAFPPDRPVRAHQLEAWTAAIRDRACFAVTSGTGSGKTECFLIPILNALAQAPARPGGGVQAILLYPLNALIASQQKRLDAWLAGFGGKLRYALYNGDTPESLNADRRRKIPAWEIPDRVRLRERPPEILVTNLTMLEYMLVRPQDRQILEASRGGLSFIVLDEAHSYAGSQAAELAMLLRRVRAGFGANPADVQLFAASATIGSAEGEAALRGLVAGLADCAPERVRLIRGSNSVVPLPPIRKAAAPPLAAELGDPDTARLYERLSQWIPARRVAEKLRAGRRLSLASVRRDLEGLDPAFAVAVLEALGRARPVGGPALAPWRMHAFLRSQPGLWSCSDPLCPEKAATHGNDTDWPFGRLHVLQREQCGCGAPVFEVESCGACGAPRLAVTLRVGAARFLEQPGQVDEDDDYALDRDPGEEETIAAVRQTWLLLAPEADSPPILDAETAQLADGVPEAGRRMIRVRLESGPNPCCGDERARPRRTRFGAPFLLGAAVPPLLFAAPDHAAAKHPSDRPASGRRLLSFTDSRQGTARLAAKLTQDSERGLVRASIWHAVQAPPAEVEGAESIRAELETLRPLAGTNPAIAAMVRDRETKLQAGPRPVPWPDMAGQLAGLTELRQWAAMGWGAMRRSDGEFGKDPERLARMLLFRETMRRPKFLNSAETMGLAQIVAPDLERTPMPDALARAGRTPADWSDFLRLCIDFVFRQQLAVKIDRASWHWANPTARKFPGFVAGPGQPAPEYGSAWPRARTGNRSPVVRFARLLLGLSADGPAELDMVDDLLGRAWNALAPVRSEGGGRGEWVLNFESLSFLPVAHAWLCPVTRRVLPYAPLGFSPYGETPVQALPVAFPALPRVNPLGLTPEERAEVRQSLARDDAVKALRDLGLWSDLHDRAAGWEPFFRAAEHSAQVPRQDLALYESQFEEGKLNVLSCSTTMEMGVDIADVSVVVNANVPPAPANYRQRIGRAGRRDEPRALAFTFCKDRPRDWAVFDDPETALLASETRPPRIRLDSRVIVQRHVNAFFLATFLRGLGSETPLRLPCGVFFGGPRDLAGEVTASAPADLFAAQLRMKDGPLLNAMAPAAALVRGTALAGVTDLSGRTAAALDVTTARWRAECRGLLGAAAEVSEEKARHSLGYRLQRLHDEFLLKELARRSFLPAYGFPVDVLGFQSPWLEERGSDAPSERADRQAGPNRPLDIAIREYAPGADVVVDGLVYRSAGLMLAQDNPLDGGTVEDLRFAWTCAACQSFGSAPGRVEACPSCGHVPEAFRLLRPAGFVSTDAPHTRYETVAFIAPRDPWVSARDGAVRALPDPAVGLMRSRSGAQILHRSDGPALGGYAVCLRCGRAAPEDARDEARPPLPKGLDQHRPLTGRRERGDLCQAGSNDILRHVRLGGDSLTDVLELLLFGLTPDDDGARAGLAIAAALREALARRIGVEAEDLGVLVHKVPATAAKWAGGRGGIALLLYDHAPGGAGFAPLAADDMPGLLREATRMLDCPAGEACTHACPRCVLARDLEYRMREIDRVSARRFLVSEVLPKLDPPPGLQAFGAATGVETRSLGAVLDEALATAEPVRADIVLCGEARDWDFSGWSLPRIARGRGASLRLLARPEALLAMSVGQKLALNRIIAETGAELARLKPLPVASDGRPVIAALATPFGWRWFAAGDRDAEMTGPGWGGVSVAPLLWTGPTTGLGGEAVDPAKFAALGLANAHRLEIGNELNGDAKAFGSRFWGVFRRSVPRFAGEAGPVARVRYRDRYVRSPLTVSMLASVLCSIPGTGPTTALYIATSPPASGREAGDLVHHDWPRAEPRDDVLRALLQGTSMTLEIVTRDPRGLPHDRSMEIVWASGTRLLLTLDQGFGAWRAEGRADRRRHDFSASAAQQAQKLAAASFDLVLDGERTLLVAEFID